MLALSTSAPVACGTTGAVPRRALVASVVPRANIAASHARSLCVAAAAAPAPAASATAVSDRMKELKEQGKTAFIPFICAGDPNLDTTADALRALDAAGASVIELGVPYSDPLADGPTIQSAATRALEQHVKLDDVLNMLEGVDVEAPIVMFTYFNPIMARGLDKFCADAKRVGASGLLVPDLPLEEALKIRTACNEAGLELVLLTTPTTPVERMAKIAAESQGFVYLVSVTGVTGARAEVSDRVQGLITDLKESTGKSVAVGFGVKDPAQAKQLQEWGADGVIVGSALVSALGEAGSPEEGVTAMSDLAKEIMSGIRD